MMHSRRLALSGVLAGLAASAFLLVACQKSYTPYAPGALTRQSARSSNSLQLYHAGLPQPQAASTCKPNKLPGTYVELSAVGNVHNGSFTPAPGPGTTQWERYQGVANGPTPAPTPTPTHKPFYFFVGTYTDKKNGVVDTVGCASFLTTQDGSALPNSKYNGEDVDSPTFSQKLQVTTILGVGTVTAMKLTLNTRGGSGTYTLSDGSTGAIKFTQRISLP